MSDIYADGMRRDAAEKRRMDSQFHIITGALGWTIHPSIAARLPASPAIADFATGTGLFLNSISAEYPNARLDGYDISSVMFPPELERSPNVRLSVLNAKDPLPAELHGVYDLIHVRYLVAGMDPEEWEPVLKNLILGLKPGGAIQWVEPNIGKTLSLRGQPDSKITTLSLMSNNFLTFHLRRSESGWNTLPGLMEQAGLAVETDVVSTDRLPESRRPLAENGLVALLGFTRKMAAAKVPGSFGAAQIDEMEATAWREIESGAYCQYFVHTAVGFKQ